MRVAALLALLSAAPALAAEPDPADPLVVSRFVSALEAGTRASFEALSMRKTVDGGEFASVRDVLERYRNVHVASARLQSVDDLEPRSLHVLLDATGTLANGRRDRAALPSRWILRVARGAEGPAIAGAATAERAAALEVIAAPDDLARRLVLEALADLPEAAVLEEVGTEAVATMARRGSNSLEFAIGLEATKFAAARALERGDRASQSRAFSALSRVEIDHDLPLSVGWADAAIAAGEGFCQETATARFALGNVLLRVPPRVTEGLNLLRAVGAPGASLDDPRPALMALHNVASVEARRMNLRASIAAAQELSRVAHAVGSLEGEAMARWTLGDVHSTLKHRRIAVDYYRQAIEGLRAAGNLAWVAIALSDLASEEVLLGEVDAAERHHEEAKRLGAGRESPWWQAEILASPIRAYLARNDLREAERLSALAFSTADKSAIPGRLHLVTARLRLAQGRPREALAMARGVETKDREEQLWESATLAGIALHRLGRRKEAEADLRRAIDMAESHRLTLAEDASVSASLFEEKLEPYRELVDLLAESGRREEALGIAERMRARALHDILVEGSVDASASLTDAEKRREQEMEERLIRGNLAVLASAGKPEASRRAAERDRARRELERFRTEIDLLIAARRDAAPPVPRMPHEEWRRRIPKAGGALEFVLAPGHSWAFFAARDEHGRIVVRARRLAAGSRALGPEIAKLRAQVAGRDPTYVAAARRLHALLIAPLEDWLSRVSVLCVVPDGVLWDLPFEVLRDERGHEIAESLAVFRAPSLSASSGRSPRDAADARRPSAALLAWADPTVASRTTMRVAEFRSGPELGPLPDARREVTDIASLYAGETTDVRVGSEAREGVFKKEASRYDVIHLATHGLIDDDAPLFSSLVLAASPEENEDGLLEMREIAEMKLNARLVVLSACESGRGPVRDGEGVVGLAWALLCAGARTTVVSDWKTDSAATTLLMVEFHRNLKAGDGVAAALRKAQQKLRRTTRYAHPYYWAPFVALGDAW